MAKVGCWKLGDETGHFNRNGLCFRLSELQMGIEIGIGFRETLDLEKLEIATRIWEKIIQIPLQSNQNQLINPETPVVNE